MKRIIGVLFLILLCTGFVFSEGQTEKSYPEKPVTVICSFPAGGLADILTRLYAQAYEEELGVPFQVINKPGGAMIPGTMALMEQPADGYSMIYYSTPGMLTLPYMNNAPYTYKDFDVLFLSGEQKNVLYVAADSEIQNMEDFVEAAKAKRLIIAINSIGAPPHLSMAQFVQTAGLEVEFLTEGTVPKSAVSTIGGHADAFVGQLTQLDQYPDEIRALAILDETGHDYLPGVPTVKEALPGMDVKATSWVRGGLAVKAGTPQPIIDLLVKTAEKVINNEEFAKAFNESGGSLFKYSGYEESKEVVQDGINFYHPMIDELGLKKAK